MRVEVGHVDLLVDSNTGQRARFVVVPRLGGDTGLRWRLFSDLVPMNRRRTPASLCQQTKSFHGSERYRLHDRESVSLSKFRSDGRVTIVAGSGQKMIQVIAVRVIGTDGSDLNPRIGVGRNEGT